MLTKDAFVDVLCDDGAEPIPPLDLDGIGGALPGSVARRGGGGGGGGRFAAEGWRDGSIGGTARGALCSSSRRAFP